MASSANLYGVWAKLDRTVEQLKALDNAITKLGSESHPDSVHSYSDRESGQYRFEIHPGWSVAEALRIAVIYGEIVHDMRSLLDNLVTQLVVLNGSVKPDKLHSFPICGKEPTEGFAAWACREWTDSRKRRRHGPLFGIGADALAIIDGCQPYNRPDGALLERLHAAWNLDKHVSLAPLHVFANPATLIPEDVQILSRDDRLERGTYIVEVSVPPGTHVDVQTHPPTEITLGGGVPIVIELREITKLIHILVLGPIADLFPGETGIGVSA